MSQIEFGYLGEIVLEEAAVGAQPRHVAAKAMRIEARFGMAHYACRAAVGLRTIGYNCSRLDDRARRLEKDTEKRVVPPMCPRRTAIDGTA